MKAETPHSSALFGEDHDEPAAYAMCSVGEPDAADEIPTTCAISVGGVAALARKGGTEVPNEDCLFALDDGRYAVHIIADGHHGHEASHDLVEALSKAYDEHGPTLKPADAIESIYRSYLLTDEPDAATPPARSTLLIARLDREEGRLSAISLGDSALFVGDVESGTRQVAESNTFYTAPWDPEILTLATSSRRISLPIKRGQWIISCSDGVTECHYGKPETSIQPADIDSLLIRASGSSDALVESLAALSLTGVRGQPGGQDNVAIIASMV